MDASDFSDLKPLGTGPNAWWVNGEVADISRQSPEPRLVNLSTDTKLLRLDTNKLACLVVDMQNDFCHPDGWLASIGVDVAPAREAIAPLQTLLPWAKAGSSTYHLAELGEIAPTCSTLAPGCAMSTTPRDVEWG
jgi:hypothetical protein